MSGEHGEQAIDWCPNRVRSSNVANERCDWSVFDSCVHWRVFLCREEQHSANHIARTPKIELFASKGDNLD
jgi:hypothetical protein